MKHYASRPFWDCYERLPQSIQKLANKNFELLKQDPAHPALHFKRIGAYRSARVGLRYRALAVEQGPDLLWFWIGSHADYDKMLST